MYILQNLQNAEIKHLSNQSDYFFSKIACSEYKLHTQKTYYVQLQVTANIHQEQKTFG